MSAIFGTKTANFSWTKFLVQPFVITFIYLLGAKCSICPKQNFCLENYYCHSQLPITRFHCAKFKKNSSSGSRVMSMCNLWVPKWPFSPNKNFFRKPVNEPCFFYSCLSTCQKSKSDINLLVKYWWLKNTEFSLAESHFCL